MSDPLGRGFRFSGGNHLDSKAAAAGFETPKAKNATRG
jgi:hypothetical protein